VALCGRKRVIAVLLGNSLNQGGAIVEEEPGIPDKRRKRVVLPRGKWEKNLYTVLCAVLSTLLNHGWSMQPRAEIRALGS